MSPSFLILNIKCLKEHLFKTPRLTVFQYNPPSISMNN